MIKTHHGIDSLPRGGGPNSIGGREYPVVEINGKLWLAVNLDFKFPDCTIGGRLLQNTPQADYYNEDENTYGWDGLKYGLLYNWHAVNYLEQNKETLLNGWRVPTMADYSALVSYIGGTNKARKLQSTSGWDTVQGTDNYGFNLKPAGYGGGTPGYVVNYGEVGKRAALWTANEADATSALYIWIYDNNSDVYLNQNNPKYIHRSLRLIKDI